MSSNVTLKDWTDALRSGKYKQGKHYLRTATNEFCCLGVLCDLVNSSLWSDEPSEGNENEKAIAFQYADGQNLPTAQLLPYSISEKFQLHAELQDILTRWNDHTDVGFIGIANIIDKCTADNLEDMEEPPISFEITT